ncbi:hypothetical protein Tco_1556894 [Tanacetum coccineum]
MQAIQRVLKYLKKTMDYSLTYTSYPSVLEGYTNASQISNTKDNSSTSGWSKPIAPISIHYDSAATLAKSYSQIYNGKSRHLGFRHRMIRELIMNRVISIEFVRSQQNFADHLTNGLARDMVIKSDEGMELKSNKTLGKLSRYTSNLGTQHWQAIQQVLRYLNKTMDYSLTYTGYPLVLEVYTDASWISNTKDNSSSSG